MTKKKNNTIQEGKKKMEPKISIVVAVYNLEQYLPRCLDALVNQTLQEIEILCVDDGSTDSAPQIVDEYAKWYTADTSNETLAFQVTHDPYLVGKYAAINEAILAVTVKAFRGEAIRDNGCAININQSYWHAATKAEFEEACQVSESFSYGKSTFDSITTAAQLQQLFDDATIENLSK